MPAKEDKVSASAVAMRHPYRCPARSFVERLCPPLNADSTRAPVPIGQSFRRMPAALRPRPVPHLRTH